MINFPQLIQMLKNNGNPMQMLSGMAQSNPQVGQVMQMVHGKTPTEIQQMVYDTAKQRGVDVNQLARQLGVRLPK